MVEDVIQNDMSLVLLGFIVFFNSVLGNFLFFQFNNLIEINGGIVVSVEVVLSADMFFMIGFQLFSDLVMFKLSFYFLVDVGIDNKTVKLIIEVLL